MLSPEISYGTPGTNKFPVFHCPIVPGQLREKHNRRTHKFA
jgi:hypothetical protein